MVSIQITWDRPTPKPPGAPVGHLTRWARTVTGSVGAVVSAVVTPHRASLTRLRDMPLSLAGTGLVDWAAFHLNTGVGLLATGLSLWLVEHLISDDDDPRRP